jgi:hypothetical protein
MLVSPLSQAHNMLTEKVSWGSRNVNEDESASSSANASTDPPNRNLLRRRSVAVST